MSDTGIFPLSLERYGQATWRRFPSYRFAAEMPILPVYGLELLRGAISLPIAFIQTSGNYQTVFVVGLNPARSALVDRGGGWRGSYIPVALRTYPFLVQTHQNELSLWVNETSGLISHDSTSDGEKFFDEDGRPTQSIQAVFDFLGKNVASNDGLLNGVASLAEKNLLTPWSVEFDDHGVTKKVEGLFCVDERRLADISNEELGSLRDRNGLMVAYVQLLSMQHMAALLEREKEVQDEVSSLNANAPGSELSLLTGDTIRFG